MQSKQLLNLIGPKTQSASLLNLTSKVSICHKSELPKKKVYHWPYEKVGYNYFNSIFDPFTKKKFNENSKIITIEGNVNAGKEDFGRRLANELGMKYSEPIDLDKHYINDYGYDYRALNPLLPERLRTCDWKMFHENPSRHSVIHMHTHVFKLKLAQYLKAIQHLFNTGQGVVINQSVFSDRVYIEAMHNLGWLPLGYLRGDGIRFYDYRLRYINLRERALSYMNKPHLSIYLDVPIEKCLDRIKNSSDPMEANSKALVPEFLEEVKNAYENVILPKIDYNGHVLKYKCEDRMDDDELADVIDDIKQLNYEYDWHDTRFEDWDDKSKKFWYRHQRIHYTSNSAFEYFEAMSQGWYDIAGMGDSYNQVDLIVRQSLIERQIGPVGYHNDYSTDISQSGFWRSIIDYEDYGAKFKRHLRTDFI